MDDLIKQRIQFFHLLVTLTAGGLIGIFGSFVAIITTPPISAFAGIIASFSFVGSIVLLTMLITLIHRLNKMTQMSE